ncbi:MAG: low molecular weight protein arginine phosphatase [Candidatus Caccovivens sp.]
MIDICFVCTGNTCRSIMAERIARKMAKNRGVEEIKFRSSGLFATGQNISENAKKALKSLGYDARNRKSVKLSKINPNTIYVTVTKDHKRFIDSKKVICFEELAGRVPDPDGCDESIYFETAKQIEKNVEILLNKIANLRGEK